jgi:F-type H+-transporting ATPase subunit b
VNADNELKDVTSRLKARAAAIKNEAFQLKGELEESGEKQAGEIFSTTQKEIENLREKTRQEIDAQISEARKRLRKESELLAVSVMEKILDRRLVS